jgi:hypothetical protein
MPALQTTLAHETAVLLTCCCPSLHLLQTALADETRRLAGEIGGVANEARRAAEEKARADKVHPATHPPTHPLTDRPTLNGRLISSDFALDIFNNGFSSTDLVMSRRPPPPRAALCVQAVTARLQETAGGADALRATVAQHAGLWKRHEQVRDNSTCYGPRHVVRAGALPALPPLPAVLVAR